MDNYLIYLIQSHNIEALNLLVEKYRKTIKNLYYKTNIEVYGYKKNFWRKN